jgi:hypothetical protein
MSSAYEVRDTLKDREHATVEVGAEQIPVAVETDVVIAGGGPAGALAAIAAGREGARVILMEAAPLLGGVMTGGGVHYYYLGVSGGLQDEVDARTEQMNQRISRSTRGFHPDARKLVLHQMAQEAGVEVWLRTCVTGVVTEDGRVTGVIVDGEPGRVAVLCGVCIDATGGGFVEGREHMWRAPYDEGNRLHYCSPILGLRQSRQAVGDYTLTLDDMFLQQCFPDTVGKCSAHYDDHALDYASDTYQVQVLADVTGNRQTQLTCDVPYRSLLVSGIEGLLVAGRCISMTLAAQCCLRMQKDMHRIGEAAGIAAALAVRDGVTPRQISVEELQAELVKSGVLTQEEIADGAAETLRGVRPPDELVRELTGERVAPAMYGLYCHGDAAFEALERALESEDGDTARWAALVLGAHRQESARETLMAMLLERDAAAPPGRYTQPRWFSAMVCLSYMGGDGVMDALIDVLDVEMDMPNHWLHALRGLARQGDAKAAGPIKDFLERVRRDEKHLPEKGKLRMAAGWKLELVGAEALMHLGDEQGVEIARRYADDARLPVRRYAQKILAAGQSDRSAIPPGRDG